MHDKKRREITLIEVRIPNLDLLTQVENEKSRKYDLIANELFLTYKCKVKIIPYVMTRLVTKYHKKHRSEIGISTKTEANKLINIVKTLIVFPSTDVEVLKRKMITKKSIFC